MPERRTPIRRCKYVAFRAGMALGSCFVLMAGCSSAPKTESETSWFRGRPPTEVSVVQIEDDTLDADGARPTAYPSTSEMNSTDSGTPARIELPESEIAELPPLTVVPNLPPRIALASHDEPALTEIELGAVEAAPEQVVEEDVIVLGVTGVEPDRRGIGDNLAVRGGVTGYRNDNSSSAGVIGILESSKQVGDRDLFLHGGIAGEYLNGEWPISFTVGASKLATLDVTEVTKPLILSLAYDGYYDSEFFQTDDTVYLDQIRALVGYALTQSADVGVWGAKGLQSDFGSVPVANGRRVVRGRLADRIAGYVARDLGNRGVHLIWSAGWEDGPGNFFTEADVFVPVKKSWSLFGGLGYSDSGAWDGVAGVEYLFGRRGRTARGATLFRKPDSNADQFVRTDPCDDCGVDTCLDCCPVCLTGTPRFRGGWAEGNYRGALRVVTPSRMRRMLMNPNAETLLAGAAPGGGPLLIPNAEIEPEECSVDPPATTHPDEECLPRWTDRPQYESRLSVLLEQQNLLNMP